MTIVRLVISDRDFNPNRSVAKDFLQLIRGRRKISDREISLIQNDFHRLVKKYGRQHPPLLGKILGGKNYRQHPIDVFFSMHRGCYKDFVDSGLSSVGNMGIILASLIQDHCQPENYIRIQEATFELLKYEKMLDPMRSPDTATEYKHFLEVGFYAIKQKSKGGKSTKRKDRQDREKLTILIAGEIKKLSNKNIPKRQWNGLIAQNLAKKRGYEHVTKELVRKHRQRHLRQAGQS